MGDRNKRDNKHVLMIEAYEKILFNNRKKERELLNVVRDKEI